MDAARKAGRGRNVQCGASALARCVDLSAGTDHLLERAFGRRRRRLRKRSGQVERRAPFSVMERRVRTALQEPQRQPWALAAAGDVQRGGTCARSRRIRGAVRRTTREQKRQGRGRCGTREARQRPEHAWAASARACLWRPPCSRRPCCAAAAPPSAACRSRRQGGGRCGPCPPPLPRWGRIHSAEAQKRCRRCQPQRRRSGGTKLSLRTASRAPLHMLRVETVLQAAGSVLVVIMPEDTKFPLYRIVNDTDENVFYHQQRTDVSIWPQQSVTVSKERRTHPVVYVCVCVVHCVGTLVVRKSAFTRTNVGQSSSCVSPFVGVYNSRIPRRSSRGVSPP